VGYLVAARIHDQPLYLPYVAVGRRDGQFAVYFYLAGRDGVDGDLLRGLRCVRVADRPDYAPNAPGAGRLVRSRTAGVPCSLAITTRRVSQNS
jgi:hypothetical protein